MKKDPKKFWRNIPRKIDRYFGDEADEFDLPDPNKPKERGKVERDYGD